MKINKWSLVGIIILILCIIGGISFPDIVFLFIFLSIFGLVILILANADFLTELHANPQKQINIFQIVIDKITGLTGNEDEILNAEKKIKSTKALLDIAGLVKEGYPIDLSAKHDTYAWE